MLKTRLEAALEDIPIALATLPFASELTDKVAPPEITVAPVYVFKPVRNCVPEAALRQRLTEPPATEFWIIPVNTPVEVAPSDKTTGVLLTLSTKPEPVSAPSFVVANEPLPT